MQMSALVNIWDRRVFFINELEMNEMAAGANSDVEVLIVELDGKGQFFCVKSDRRRHIRRAQLRDNAADRHMFMLSPGTSEEQNVAIRVFDLKSTQAIVGVFERF